MPSQEEKSPRTYRAVILTALAVEYQAVRAHLSELREETHPEGTIYEWGRFVSEGSTWEVLLVEIGAGNARAAFETERAIRHFEPDVALFIGVAGGMKDVALGDVVAASKVYGYESGKVSQQFETRPDVMDVSYALEQRARREVRRGAWLHRLSVKPVREPRVWVGPIAAGEKVLAETHSELHRFLRTHYGDSLAVEMEGRGFLTAMRGNSRVHALVIRGISDLIDDKAVADAAGSQEEASRHASAFAFEVLARFAPPGRGLEVRESGNTGDELVWTVPHPRNPSFTGREAGLDAIRAHFLSATNPAPLALFGLGGVGKTQLVVEYAHRHAHVEPYYTHVLWLRADEPAVLLSSYAGLAAALGLPEEKEAEHARKVAAVRHWLSQNDRWLLVFDNAKDRDTLRPYLPPVLRGHVLVTSRDTVWRPIATPLPVQVLERAESIELLRKGTGQQDSDALSKLAEALGDLPLALTQAAAYIEQTGLSLADYLVLLEKRQQELLARPGAPADYPYTVTATWELSFEQVQAQSAAGAALLKLCAFLAPSPIPLDLLIHGAAALPEPLSSAASDELRLNDALGALRRYSLVQLHQRELLFHRLVQGVMRDRLGEERGFWAGVALRLVHGFFVFNQYDLSSWSRCTVLLPHALDAMVHASDAETGQEMLPGLFWNLGKYWTEQADYELARDFMEGGLKVLQQLPEAQPPTEASLHQGLGHVALATGKLNEAEEHLTRAQQLIQSIPQTPEQQMAVAITLGELSLFHVKRGHLDEARAYADQALEIGEAILPADHPSMGVLLSRKAAVLWNQGEYDQAQVCVERSMAISEATFGSPHPRLAQDLNNRAKVMAASGRHEEAKPLYERSLEMTEAIYGPHHPHVATVLGNLGDTYRLLGNGQKARECYERALRIEEDFLGAKHAALKLILTRLVRVLHDEGDYPSAQVHQERIVSLLEDQSGPESSALSVALTDLATLHFKQENFPEARRLVERALAIDQKIHGPNHPEVVKDLLNLALLLLLLGETERSRELVQRALSIYETQGSVQPSHFFVTLFMMGRVLYEREDWASARTYLEQALRFGVPVTPDVAQTAQLLLFLGSALRHLREYAAAIAHLERASTLPVQHTDTELLQMIQAELDAARADL